MADLQTASRATDSWNWSPQVTAPLVSVVLPCLNEEEALGGCIQLIEKVFKDAKIDGEIVVCDNGSTDRSVEIAESMGVRVVHQPKRGYGNAYIKGFSRARGRYLIMGDADATYDFNLIPEFVRMLQQQEYDFVTGSRYLGKGDAHITFLHRWVGNPILTLLLNFMFGAKYTDVYCGFRAFTREAYARIQPVSPGMEFNLELAINASLAKLMIAEIPIVLGPRKGVSKLNTFRDGWRSLRMMLLYCPNKVFLLPGILLLFAGIALHLITLLELVRYEGRAFGQSGGTSAVATICCVLGVEILSLGLQAKTYSWSRRFSRNQLLSMFYKQFTLESGLALGGVLLLSGIGLLAAITINWLRADLVALTNPSAVALSATLIMVGTNVIFSSLFISAMSVTPPANFEDIAPAAGQ